MPVDIRAIQRKGVTVPVPFYGETINVTYDPFQMTRDFREDWINTNTARLEALREEHGDMIPPREMEIMIAESMVMVVKSWDLQEDGEMYPLDPERIANELPGLSLIIRDAVFEDANNLGNRNGSPNSSRNTRRGSNLRAV